VDEVQRLPSLLNEVHRSIEERGLRFVLSGSSARKLRHGGVNLLAGRALLRSMHPFLPPELEGRFSLDAALRIGTLPIVLASTRPEETLRACIHGYLKEEIQAEALVRSLAGFARFLPVAALLHGQMVNVSSLARDAGVARTTVNDYLEILEDTLLAFRVPGFEARLRVRERKHPKLYWVDAGLVRAAKDQLAPLAIEERGPLFEGLVANSCARGTTIVGSTTSSTTGRPRRPAGSRSTSCCAEESASSPSRPRRELATARRMQEGSTRSLSCLEFHVGCSCTRSLRG